MTEEIEWEVEATVFFTVYARSRKEAEYKAYFDLYGDAEITYLAPVDYRELEDEDAESEYSGDE